MNKEIIVQVAFKGAIKCVVNGKSDISEVEKLTNTFTDIMLDEVKQRQDFAPEVKVPFESEPPNEPYNNGGSSTSYEEKPATDKQKKFVNSLFYQLPQTEQDKYKDSIKPSSMTMQVASDLIKKFQAILDTKEETVTPF